MRSLRRPAPQAHTLAVAKAHPEMATPCWGWMAADRFKTDVDSDDCMALDPTNPAARAMVRSPSAGVLQNPESLSRVCETDQLTVWDLSTKCPSTWDSQGLGGACR